MARRIDYFELVLNLTGEKERKEERKREGKTKEKGGKSKRKRKGENKGKRSKTRKKRKEKKLTHINGKTGAKINHAQKNQAKNCGSGKK